MVAGPCAGPAMAARMGLDALFITRDGAGGLHGRPVGRLFGERAEVPATAGG